MIRNRIAGLLLQTILTLAGSVDAAGLQIGKFNLFEAMNKTKPEVYKGQKAGYGTVGSFSARNPIVKKNPIKFSFPSAGAGCGGIDLYGGGFEYINAEEFISALKAIGGNAAGYAFFLAIETVSPMIAEQLKDMQNFAQDINTFSINSCEMGSLLASAAWPRDTQASQHICRQALGTGGELGNWVSAHHRCGETEESFEEGLRRFQESNPNSLHLPRQYNLAWEAIKAQGLTSADNSLAEYCLNVTGTIIRKKTGEKGEYSYDIKPSRIGDGQFLKALLEGGSCEVYKTSSSDPLMVTLKEESIGWEESCVGRASSQLKRIQDCIIHDNEISAEDVALLSNSWMPLYQIVKVLTASHGEIAQLDLEELVEIVALESFYQDLKQIIEVTIDGATAIKLSSSDPQQSQIDEFIRQLERSEMVAVEIRRNSQELVDRRIAYMKKIDYLDKQLDASIKFR